MQVYALNGKRYQFWRKLNQFLRKAKDEDGWEI